ncbi:MAG: ACP S-malonyltransferase [Kiritimatiellia bacterium]
MSKTAIVFAGQGAQFVGMGKDLVDAYPVCRALYEEADAVLGYSLSKLCFEGPLEDLTKSNHCQPAIFVTSMACYRALQEKVPGLAPVAMAGLSLGEWSALHAAGVLGFADTLRILQARGAAMQVACEEKPGGMVSVMGLGRSDLEAICGEAGVEMANLNSEEQTVLSGSTAGIEKAEALAKARGAKRAIVLEVAGAFHSSLMQSAVEKLAAVLGDVVFTAPAVPVVSNVTGAFHGDTDAIRREMLRQVTGSVHWYEGVGVMTAAGADTFVECGPGKVLSGLIKRIAKGASLTNIQDTASLAAAAAALV